MSLLHKLDEVIEDAVTSEIIILNKYRRNDNTIFCLVEGVEDISFYRGFVERYYTQKIEFINCHGKENVIENYNVLNWNIYDKKRLFFFVDKDFDNFIGRVSPVDSNFFVTEHYSIENYLVTRDVLKKFLIDNCFLTNESEIERILTHFTEEHKRFGDYLKKMASWMIFCRNHRFKVCFDDIKLSKLFKMDHTGKISKIKTPNKKHFELICEQIHNTFYDLTEIRQNYSLLANTNHKDYLRGKFEMFFMFVYLKYIVNEIVPVLASKVTTYNKLPNVRKKLKPKVVIQIKEENLFQVLCGKVSEPALLKSFFQQNSN